MCVSPVVKKAKQKSWLPTGHFGRVSASFSDGLQYIEKKNEIRGFSRGGSLLLLNKDRIRDQGDPTRPDPTRDPFENLLALPYIRRAWEIEHLGPPDPPRLNPPSF